MANELLATGKMDSKAIKRLLDNDMLDKTYQVARIVRNDDGTFSILMKEVSETWEEPQESEHKPRGLRNNNPGNIRSAESYTWEGAVGEDVQGGHRHSPLG